jgi:hypothetical protein
MDVGETEEGGREGEGIDEVCIPVSSPQFHFHFSLLFLFLFLHFKSSTTVIGFYLFFEIFVEAFGDRG